MIGIIDYGLGNIKAFENIYKKLNFPIKRIRDISDFKEITKIILPGVGAFDHAMIQLRNSGLMQRLTELVISESLPILGVCVGMQMLGKDSEEGKELGLGWIDGQVKKFNTSKFTQLTQLPHMGWNDVYASHPNKLFVNLEKDSKFYFLHSFFFECNNSKDIVAVSHYPSEFTCAINNSNIYGVQFHPEKSHDYGLKLLENFAKL